MKIIVDGYGTLTGRPVALLRLISASLAIDISQDDLDAERAESVLHDLERQHVLHIEEAGS